MQSVLFTSQMMDTVQFDGLYSFGFEIINATLVLCGEMFNQIPADALIWFWVQFAVLLALNTVKMLLFEDMFDMFEDETSGDPLLDRTQFCLKWHQIQPFLDSCISKGLTTLMIPACQHTLIFTFSED